jgi:glycosyltransferase involved in cell wall biosynthesis
MKVLVVNESLGNDASYLARCAPYLPGLQQRGIETMVVQYRPYIWKQRPHDVIWWRRVGVADDEARALQAARKRVVYDFDDAVFEVPDDLKVPGRTDQWPFLKQRFLNIAGLARVALAGSEYLATKIPNPLRAVVWRTGVTETAFTSAAARRGGVWTGSRATLPYLMGARDVIARMHARTGAKLTVVCDAPPAAASGPWLPWQRDASAAMEWVPWVHEHQAEPLGKALVGFAPLPATDYARGKCGFKVVQYMAAGLPVVADSVAVHNELFQLGCRGLVAGSRTAQLEFLVRMLENPTEAAELGAENRELARDQLTTAALLPVLVNALHDAAGA